MGSNTSGFSDNSGYKFLFEINRIGNLYTVGRQGGFSYTGMADSMDIGFKTAAFISQGKDKSGDWIAYGRQFYNYVVVD